MAKSSVLAKLEALPRGRHGKSFLETLTPKQLADFTECVKWYHAQAKPPTGATFVKAVNGILGLDVSRYTILRYLADAEYIDKQKAR